MLVLEFKRSEECVGLLTVLQLDMLAQAALRAVGATADRTHMQSIYFMGSAPMTLPFANEVDCVRDVKRPST